MCFGFYVNAEPRYDVATGPVRHSTLDTRMKREEHIARLSKDTWDIIVIGGGAVGMGTALDAAARGYSCVLFEQHDFCKGTSSRSTKLIHGGVRYLAQGNVSLVREALHERGLLLRNAPSLVKPLRFVVPCESFWGRWYYWFGMKCYDALAGRLGIKSSHQLSTAEVQSAIPGLRTDSLNGGVAYFDAQFDDARLVIGVAQKVQELGGVPLNYMQVTNLITQNGRVSGVQVNDVETGSQYEVTGKVVVNATGAFSDDIRRMESASAPQMIAPSQGIHLVVDLKFLGGEDAIMIPKTKDGRVLFAIPWLGRAVLGTTDTPVERASLEPAALEEEVNYLIEHFADYLKPTPTREDVLSVYVGLRPLVRPKTEAGATSKISREHRIVQSAGGLISILGGKWTTFRKMAEDVVNACEEVASVSHRRPTTRDLKLEISAGSQRQSPDARPTTEQVREMARNEFARTVEDVLARRFRSLLLNAELSKSFAVDVANTLADELGRPDGWSQEQVEQYHKLADSYSL